MTFDKLDIYVDSVYHEKPSPPVLDLNNDWGKHYQWWGKKKPVRLSLAIVTSQSHINENISSNIYAISSAANPFERTEPQV